MPQLVCQTIDCANTITAPPSPITLKKAATSIFNTFHTYTSWQSAPSISRARPRSFDVDAESGFVPRRPLTLLSGKFSLWEEALVKAQDTLRLADDDAEDAILLRPAGDLWRSELASVSNITSPHLAMTDLVLQWPVLDVAEIDDLRSLQRAHKVLAWLVHFYAHSSNSDKSTVHIPISIAKPLVEVSLRLETAPVLTYADTVLWNWEFINPEGPMTMDNIRVENTFSGTDDERSFYLVSLEVELRAVEALDIINQFEMLSRSGAESAEIARCLERLRCVIDDVTTIVSSVRALCNPHVFYWQVRSWFEGVDAHPGPDDKDWVYEGVPKMKLLDFRNGPSGGQSSAMHALDVFLNIDHALREKRFPEPSAQNKRSDAGFMARMRQYMPGLHRQYLENLERLVPSARHFALSNEVVREQYNETVMAFKKMRDVHMRVASSYIIKISRGIPAIPSICPASAMLNAMASGAKPPGVGPARGTGGNEVVTLLKAGVDATRRAIV